MGRARCRSAMGSDLTSLHNSALHLTARLRLPEVSAQVVIQTSGNIPGLCPKREVHHA